MHKIMTTSLLIASLGLSGCANMSETQKGTAKGAGIGAAAGGVVGALAGGGKGAAIGAAIGAGAGAIAGNVWSKKMEAQKQEMEQATAGTGVAVTKTENNQLKLEIPSDISFDSGKANIKPNFRAILDKFATGLQSNPATRVTIIGHTDSSGSDAVNDPLSVNRAASTRSYLVDRGVAISRITIDGRGSHEPVAANDTEANRAKNRRVEIFVAEPEPAPAN
ncbi:Outer membrane protein OmpA [Methylophilus rhizosphaerae]|uniref:Outer membrane protein OmpA n=1 Tax=Methylophilus rhizosphaerae TaxID=492660 RepID=A0A1G9BDY1_9PROT|nr:OmpA family protein [Methylophilus rhizosphaerae]SDK37746.1 Outer membrane protein OmpA [Methylophilus rhizosphaerae]